MAKILTKKQLNPDVYLFELEANAISKKVEPGQFIILRVDEFGERVPLTIADHDAIKGTITIIVQAIGKTTLKLSKLNEGDSVLDLVGPLGRPTEIEEAKKVCVVGGGVGTAIAYPSAKYLATHNVEVDMIAGFRNTEMIILENEMKAIANDCVIMTDDGSNGNKGFVTNALEELLKTKEYDLVIAIGPIPMMRAICDVTKAKNIKTIVSLNPIMIDGTGMCGGCRVTVDGQTKFACVDGPDFDGHKVDFSNLVERNRMYRDDESHQCRLMKEEVK
ncbi:MAG: sulfide/dihydroorotate dehydrogenase-like FAD/NAD-binding protein [Anaerorhabdus sp.]|uniref:sulfide/dihydroorotate dehydrogenase-like FAD/NAD-binding protein n=1 Tax=Anaerorhabdus sp. TaxID=1872524 RepID=UPI003A85A2DE